MEEQQVRLALVQLEVWEISLTCYLWADGSTDSSRTNLSGGVYTVTITDDSLCSKVEQVVISEPAAISSTYSIQTPSCNGLNNGSIQSNINGGSGNYQYNWNTLDTTASISSISSGNYMITVTDGDGCLFLDTITVSEPDTFTIVSQITNPTCAGDMNGSIINNVSGGTTPYSYSWDNGVQNSSLTNIGVGAYIFIVTDANGCTDTATYQIQSANPITINFTIQNEDCNAQSGSILSNISGGTTPYNYVEQ